MSRLTTPPPAPAPGRAPTPDEEKRARALSEETICVSRKWRVANVDLPQAAGPHRTTTAGLVKRILLSIAGLLAVDSGFVIIVLPAHLGVLPALKR